jgi:hypothetical protein
MRARDTQSLIDSDNEQHETDGIEIDHVFKEHIGEMGRHQQALFCMASLPWWSGAFLTYNMTFVVRPRSGCNGWFPSNFDLRCTS